MNTLEHKKTGFTNNKPIFRNTFTALSPRPFHICHCLNLCGVFVCHAQYGARANAGRKCVGRRFLELVEFLYADGDGGG